MKKIILLFVLFFNLIPNVRDDGFSFFLTSSYAQSFGDEDGDDGEICERDGEEYMGEEDCNEVWYMYTVQTNCATDEIIGDYTNGHEEYFPIPGCGEDDDDDDWPEYRDCAGDINGSAYMADCGCIGGSTGIYECPPEEEDCNGDPGGSAYMADCGCIGGNTGIYECPPLDTWYLDSDGDGWGNSAVTQDAYSSPGTEWILQGGDYNDNCYNIANLSNQCQPTCSANGGFSSSTIASGYANPSMPLETIDFGRTDPESITIDIFACYDGTKWNAVLSLLKGNYSIRSRILSHQTEVTGPTGNTTSTNFCDQVKSLKSFGLVGNWYMLSAVQAHEQKHETRLLPALESITPEIEAAIESLSVPYTGQSSAQATLQLKALQAYNTAISSAYLAWQEAYSVLLMTYRDHSVGGPTETAENAIVLPMISTICNHAQINSWPTCTSCP